jgi:hypothetical protein
MFRAMISAAVVSVVMSTSQAAHADTNIIIGKKFEGELTLPQTRISNVDEFRNTALGYATQLTVALKAGQEILITAQVVGKERKVGILLEDPAGARVVYTNFKEQRVVLSAEEVSATGKYKITVISDRIGPFTLKATDPAKDDEDSADVLALEETVKRLRKELEEAEAKLKAAKPKK